MVGFIIGLSVAFVLAKIYLPHAAEMEKLPEPFYSVLWENEHVRIVEHTMAPGDSEPMHTHPEMLAYVKYGPDSSEHQAKTETDQEIRRLKKELRRVTEERDILKKAAVYFASQSE